tara:strand:- start:34282 stop:34533 length:252 start_codon:yes stop_codon:yes gene_type:complete
MNENFLDFVDYCYSFYGAEDALYPMGVNKEQIAYATLMYLDACAYYDKNKGIGAPAVWGDGDSLDRERVRDIMRQRYSIPQAV